ncbi:hypothetical protein LC613_28720 [Nostoc sphaeroides CHAB 2801]|uniref:hypothetical protein n=1 Tax=Nostoc sphaeroides TaxID=446679 RepID=UPI000E4846C7|nr:hypothetical protein [Nostoc sphaeroides]MCC5631704.1 hypothetical protein [Nostoc sphaeroides CHAB 2801]
MTYTTTFFGELNSNDAELVTVDNVSVVSILRELDQDMLFYTDMNTRFFGSLVENVSTPQKVVKFYDGEGLESFTEAARPTSSSTVWDYVQEIPYSEFFTALTLTKRAVQLMTSEEVAAYVQSKLTSFQKSRFSSLRQALFSNTNRVVIDSINKYQTTSLPFYNSDVSVAAPPVNGYNFVAGDLQHYNAVASAGSPTLAEIRTKLIDKVRHHGFRQIEIWVSDYDYSFENLAGFVPAENQIGRNLEIQSGSANGERQRQLSPFEGLVGYISNTPIIKTPVAPVGYAVAIGADGGPNRTPLLSRQPQVASLAGLQTDVKSTFALENTIMSEGWGYAANHRGAAAVLQLNATSYTAPTV